LAATSSSADGSRRREDKLLREAVRLGFPDVEAGRFREFDALERAYSHISRHPLAFDYILKDGVVGRSNGVALMRITGLDV
jgi:hypothetical protein